MFDSSMVVSSAISSFNNAALVSPDFFWAAILCIPIFIAAWIFAKPVADKFKFQNFDACLVSAGAFAIWIMARENFAVLRVSFSWTGVIIAACLVICMAMLSRRYYDGGWRVSKYIKNIKYKSRTDFALPAVVAVIAFACALPNWKAGLMHFAAVVIGIIIGYWRSRKNKQTIDPTLPISIVAFLVAFMLISQPEFFRFGQMGNLTFVHILFLSVAATLLAMYFATKFVRPAGWLKKSWYKKFKLLGRLGILFLFILFDITESELIFIALALAGFIYFAVAVRHTQKSDAEKISDARRHIWYFSLCLIGVLTAMPLLTVMGIILYKTDTRKLPADALKSLL
ncbi:MAG: hypothetical protein FWG18_02000 [Alphaproteobacteria bacterium]|nr:hypothetical protein [Alphaproteobacteria bacterium]